MEKSSEVSDKLKIYLSCMWLSLSAPRCLPRDEEICTQIKTSVEINSYKSSGKTPETTIATEKRAFGLCHRTCSTEEMTCLYPKVRALSLSECADRKKPDKKIPRSHRYQLLACKLICYPRTDLQLISSGVGLKAERAESDL